ncbi:hypothetical protein [Streptomyces justiciae]|uniref:hypothetical protein n=1 Tax=Streptomyces justiciae TaxID=2780140 RepID=UPI00187FA89B|nr:hypothetical protein [Streptomyces justiciae]MBE8475609.1 hypothetical protein [Streptomyces justiciae]MCW8382532.1 hypothetical protein [Streptomyces justiciae]
MVSVAHTAQRIEDAAESLQEELSRLEVQRQALERELAAVVAHHGSVLRALRALQDLMPLSTAKTSTAPVGQRVAGPTDSARDSRDQPLVEEPVASADRSRPAERTQAPARRPAARTADTDTGQGKYGQLTEQILEYFAGTGGESVRARDVAAALGRDQGAGSINAVRSTLDRLVGASRIQRAGRGLYRANSAR